MRLSLLLTSDRTVMHVILEATNTASGMSVVKSGSPTVTSSELAAGGVHTWLSTGGVEVCVLMESVTYSVSYGRVSSRENTSDPKN